MVCIHHFLTVTKPNSFWKQIPSLESNRSVVYRIVCVNKTIMLLTPFSPLFQLYRCGQCSYPCFSEVLLHLFSTIFFPSHWLLCHIAIVESIDSSERGTDPFAMTIISPQKDYDELENEPVTCSQALFATNCCGLFTLYQATKFQTGPN